ncbi:MAG: hypothetical protein PHX10_09035 [Gallionellaceae bacterium]|nr:hypothetical protein [Gallionellaceae bacterium]
MNLDVLYDVVTHLTPGDVALGAIAFAGWIIASVMVYRHGHGLGAHFHPYRTCRNRSNIFYDDCDPANRSIAGNIYHD